MPPSESTNAAFRTGATLREELRRAPFALAMSSGFFAFFAHTGFLSVLEEEGLLPTRITGSSAGALVGGAWAAGLDAARLAGELERLERRDFWDPAPGPGLLRGRLFRERLETLLPTSRFERCRVPLAVSVFDVRRRTTEVLSTGPIAPALCASCAVPFLFHPVRIAGRAYVDGGVADRPGLHGMPHGTRVLYHHIASRSPWRRTVPAPVRPGLLGFVIPDLPRSGPFKLAEGRRAFRVAREATKRALERRIGDGYLEA